MAQLCIPHTGSPFTIGRFFFKPQPTEKRVNAGTLKKK
jgi:hypothetical protein